MSDVEWRFFCPLCDARTGPAREGGFKECSECGNIVEPYMREVVVDAGENNPLRDLEV